MWYPSNFLIYEPRQANLCLRAFRHDEFQLRMPSHLEGPGIWLSVWRFLLTHCLYERAVKVLARLRGCALAWTFAARICYKYQIRLTRSIWWNFNICSYNCTSPLTGIYDSETYLLMLACLYGKISNNSKFSILFQIFEQKVRLVCCMWMMWHLDYESSWVCVHAYQHALTAPWLSVHIS